MGGALAGTTTPSHGGPGNNGNERVVHPPQISRIGSSSQEKQSTNFKKHRQG